jgi:hypothetical protein
MRRVRVCLYGGTDLKGTPSGLVSEIAYEILRRMADSVVVTGGFMHSGRHPDAVSTDAAALAGARRYCEESGDDLATRFEAWVPGIDGRPEIGGVVRMAASDGVVVRTVAGRTPLGRRLAMVRDVDVVVTMGGRRHTEVVGEHALEIGIPFLPIPIAGGDSETLMAQHHDKIAEAFAPGALDRCLAILGQATGPVAQAAAVVALLQTARLGRCLVLMPYDDEHEHRYQEVVEPAVARHMVPVRLDRLAGSGVIAGNFAEATDSAAAVIVDITRLNENVMYEIGFVHGRGLDPLVYTTDEDRRGQLPVYLASRNVPLAVGPEQLGQLVEDHLVGIRAGRGWAMENPR